MKRARMLSCSTAALAALALPVAALEITLPVETAQWRESQLPGYALAVAMCQTCHSVDYVQSQPVSARAWWKSNVVKMQKTFGAPIPDEAVEPIVDYLVKTYGAERPASVSSAANSTAVQPTRAAPSAPDRGK